MLRRHLIGNHLGIQRFAPYPSGQKNLQLFVELLDWWVLK